MLHPSVFARAIALALRGVGCSDVTCFGDWICCKRGEACYTLRFAVCATPGCVSRPVDALRFVGVIGQGEHVPFTLADITQGTYSGEISAKSAVLGGIDVC